jgi:gas vesicle protein
MPFTTDSYDANESHAHLLGIRDGVRDSARSGLDVPQHMQLFNVHFTALDEAARQGGRLPDAWRAKPGMQTDHLHMTTAVCRGDRVISEESRTILKGKAGALREAVEAWKQLKREGDNPRVVLEELERVADEAENLAKHLQVLGVVDGLFEGWEI